MPEPPIDENEAASEKDALSSSGNSDPQSESLPVLPPLDELEALPLDDLEPMPADSESGMSSERPFENEEVSTEPPDDDQYQVMDLEPPITGGQSPDFTETESSRSPGASLFVDAEQPDRRLPDRPAAGGESIFTPADSAPTRKRSGGRRKRKKQPLPEMSDEMPEVDPLYSRTNENRITLILFIGVFLVGWLNWTWDLVYIRWFPTIFWLTGFSYVSYRFVITIEPPVRTTPEQGMREFLEAFCHRFPNYRRMYDFLTGDEQSSSKWGVEPRKGFKRYWLDQKREILGEGYPCRAVAYRMERVHTEYNKQRNFARIECRLTLFPRGPAEKGQARPVEMTLAKGTDNCWYLNEGKLP